MMREFLILHSLCTTLAVRYTPDVIAYAAIYAATQASNANLSTIHGTPWWVTKQVKVEHLKGLD